MIKTFAQAEQVLASRLPGYTERPQQQRLAAFVEQTIAEGGHGLAEAGCGVGKSLGTMIPAILGGKKTVVATATKALMEQYANKDIPFLEENLGVPFTWALVKGRSNYLCRAKAVGEEGQKVRNIREVLAEIEDPEHSGDFEHFEARIEETDKRFLSTSSDECPGRSDCPFGEVCFAEKAKEKGRQAQVVVTNFAMLMTDLKVRELTDGNATMLGPYDLVLLDEAHELESYATSALEAQIKQRGIEMLVGEAETFAKNQGQSLSTTSSVGQSLHAAWATLEEEGQKTLRFFVEHSEPWLDLIDALEAMAKDVSDLQIRSGGQKSEGKRNRLVKRAKNYATNLGIAITTDDELLVRWVATEEDKRTRTERKTFNIAPVHVGSYLAEWLWDTTPSVLISATLSVRGDFSFISERLGLPSTTKDVSVGTPFDYTKQALLFTPPASAPDPKKNQGGWLGYYQTVTREMVTAAGGGALLLFTSRRSMQAAYEALAPSFEARGINCYMQGTHGTNKEIARKFNDDVNSVLFGLASFMTGVDFQGETCRMVIIDKLPFPVPSDPIFAARANQIDKHGGSSFRGLTIPMMTLTLDQAYGRLIRTSNDKGVVAILDSRLSSTGYGKQIVNGLPNSPRTSNLADVQAFFAEGR